ncbi:MAG: ABC transporter substrate-binding protein [Acidimicrobiales bacterium]|nr:ABC transporter substrate-binding protein [Acidimicrobiales bacterium]
MLALVVACTSGDPPDLNRSADADPTTTAPADESSSTTTVGSTETSASPHETDEGTLRLGLADVASLDPVGVSPASSAQVMLTGLLFDTLTHIDPRGSVQPGLAAYTASADLTRWRFEIDPDATFADGSAVTAADVVYSIGRIQQGGRPAGLRLEGMEVSAIDEQTVEFALDSASAVLPELLAAPVMAITEENAFAEGSGVPTPSDDYRIASADDEQLVLERRRGRGAQTLVIERFETEDGALDAYLAGDLDWTISPPERLGEALAAAGTRGLEPFHGGLYLGVDAGVAPLDDQRLRQAIALAVDRRGLTDKVFGSSAQPLWGVIPSGVAGGSTKCRGEWCGPDRERASSLVSEVFPDGQSEPLRVLVDDTSTQRAIGDEVERQLGEVGLEAEVESVPVDTDETPIISGRKQLFVFGWLGLTRSPTDHVPRLFLSTSPGNVSGLSDDGIDRALAEAIEEPIPAERSTVWLLNEQRILDRVPVVPLVQFRTTGVMSQRLEGFDVQVDGTVDLTGVRLDGCGSDTGDC